MTASNPTPADSSSKGFASARKVALWVVSAASVALTTILTLRVLNTTLWPDVDETSVDCASSLPPLYEAVERAKKLAETRADGELAALAAFRSALLPEWENFEAVRKSCKKSGDRNAALALRQVELLRYAEERAVRYEAIDLSRLRLEAPKAVAALGPTPKKTP